MSLITRNPMHSRGESSSSSPGSPRHRFKRAGSTAEDLRGIIDKRGTHSGLESIAFAGGISVSDSIDCDTYRVEPPTIVSYNFNGRGMAWVLMSIGSLLGWWVGGWEGGLVPLGG